MTVQTIDWGKMISCAVNVADIASQVLPLLATKGNPTTELGPVRFFWQGPELMAFNAKEPEGVGLAYSVTTSSDALSIYQPLPHGNMYPVNADFREFGQGTLTIAPNPIFKGSNGVISRTICYSIAAIGIGTAFRIMGGLEIGFRRDESSERLFARATNDRPMEGWQFRIHAESARGEEATIEFDGRPAPATQVEAGMPSGISGEPSLQNVRAEIEVPNEYFLRATEDRLKLIQAGPIAA